MEKTELPTVELTQTVFISCDEQDTTALQFVSEWVKPALQRAGLQVVGITGPSRDSETSSVAGIGPDTAAWREALDDQAAYSAVQVAVYSSGYPTSVACMRALDLALHGRWPGLDQAQRLSRRKGTPNVIPVFFQVDVSPRSDPFWEQLPSIWEAKDAALRSVDKAPWLNSLKGLAGRFPHDPAGEKRLKAVALTGDDVKVIQQASRRMVELVLAAMYQGSTVAYDWQQAVELAAEAAVPKPGQAGVWVQSQDDTGNNMVRDLLQLLSPPWTNTQRPFQQSVCVDLQSCVTSRQPPVKTALHNILSQLGDGKVTPLRQEDWLSKRVEDLTKNKAILWVLLNLTGLEQLDVLVPAVGPGSFIFATSQHAKPGEAPATSDGELLNGMHQVAAAIPQDWNKILEVGGQQPDITTMSLADLREQVKQALQGKIEQLPPEAWDMFFDCVSVLDGQPYAQVLNTFDPDENSSLHLLVKSGLVDSDPLNARLIVHSVAKELARQYLCDRQKAEQFGFKVGSRLWLDDDGKLPVDLAKALEGGERVDVLAAKVDAATLSRLAKHNQLAQARIIIVTKSSSDSRLPVPGGRGWRNPKALQPKQNTKPQRQQQQQQEEETAGQPAQAAQQVAPLLPSLLWLDLECGVVDLAPWIEHAPQLVVLKATEAKTSLMRSIKAWLPRWLVPGARHSMEAVPQSIGSLPALKILDLHDCRHLSSLPDSLAELHLRELHLQRCCSLRALPQDLGLISTLSVLDLSGCSSLPALPGGIGRLDALRELDLTNCTLLHKLPPSIWDLTGLQYYKPPVQDKPPAESELPALPPQFRLKPLHREQQDHFTLLSIDGGGMRGLIPARVLEVVEDILKKEAYDILKKGNTDAKRALQARFEGVPDDVPNGLKSEKDISVDLADFFDVISGTSTGSILAAYLATKGGFTADNILFTPEYKDGVAAYKEFKRKDAGIQADEMLLPGSAKAAQAMLAAAGPAIFPRHGFLKGTALSLGGTKVMCRHGSAGIDKVLQQAFGRDTAAIRLSSSALLTSQQGSNRPALHTALLVPTFYLEGNNAVLFWHGNFRPPHARTGPAWGMTTLNRLQPPDWLPDCIARVKEEAGIVKRDIPIWSHDIPAKLKATLVFRSYGDSLQVYCQSPEGGEVDGRTEVLDFQLWDVVRASTAAPTFFPAHKISVRAPLVRPGHEEWHILDGHFVDGGVVANNPTIAGLSYLNLLHPQSSAANTAVLSLGCGTWCDSFSALPATCGEIGAGRAIVNILMGTITDTGVAAGELLYRTARRNMRPTNTPEPRTQNSFLRIQAVARPVRGGKNTDPTKHPQVSTVTPTSSSSTSTLKKIWDTTYVVPPTETAQMAAMQRMDVPSDWQALLQIGGRLAEHHKEDIRSWVKQYLLGLLADDSPAQQPKKAPQAPEPGTEEKPPIVFLGKPKRPAVLVQRFKDQQRQH